MNEMSIKKTQDTLGKIIKKPPLTQKLLGRPPFRFLHDIFTEVIKTTGFMKGLYGENELKSDNVKDKESKMIFLQKAIDVVMLVTGEPLAAKPGHIVAGHEPEKTNELLQAIAKCCLNKMSSDDAVKRVLAGEKVDTKTKASTSRPRDKDNKEGGERHLDREEKKKIIEHSESKVKKTSDQPKEQESRHRQGEKQDHREKDRTAKQHRTEQERHTNDRDNDKKPDLEQQGKDYERKKRQDRDHHSQDRGRDKEPDKYKDEGRIKERDKKDREMERDKAKDKKRDRERTRERDSDRERDREKQRDREKEQEKQTEHKERGDSSKNGENGNIKARVSEELQHTATKQMRKPLRSPPAADGPARIPRPSSAKGQRQRPTISNQAESDSEGDGDAQLDQKPASQENRMTAVSSDVASSKIPRPSSARPAPPPIKRQQSYTDLAQSERMSSAKPLAPVIMDERRLSEDDDEQFVIDVVRSPPDAPVVQEKPTENLDSEEKHGGLVKKILETKKDYEASETTPSVVSEAEQQRQRNMVAKELEQLSSSIQNVCSSTLPLGACMNYVQEDIDAMKAERNSWRQKNLEYNQALQEEERETKRVLDPLLAELAELELLIKKKQEKIFTSKSNILKNQDKIKKMTRTSFSPGS